MAQTYPRPPAQPGLITTAFPYQICDPPNPCNSRSTRLLTLNAFVRIVRCYPFNGLSVGEHVDKF